MSTMIGIQRNKIKIGFADQFCGTDRQKLSCARHSHLLKTHLQVGFLIIALDLRHRSILLCMRTVTIGGASWDSRVQRKTMLSNAYHSTSASLPGQRLRTSCVPVRRTIVKAYSAGRFSLSTHHLARVMALYWFALMRGNSGLSATGLTRNPILRILRVESERGCRTRMKHQTHRGQYSG